MARAEPVGHLLVDRVARLQELPNSAELLAIKDHL